MNKCFDNKVIPNNNNIGFCDCCYSENVEIEVCPSNNKCEYAMCKKCIKNIKKKTESKKCPACRETIINIENINLEEPESNEDNISRIWTFYLCCCEFGFVGRRPKTCYQHLIIWGSCFNMICCCVYNQLKINNDKRAAAIYSFLLHIALIMMGRVVHYEFYIEDKVFWCIWYMFILKSILGIALGICAVVIFLFALGCLYDCCCKEHDI
jgi:hypothetical protein